MRYRLVVRLTPADVGKRVVIRWRPGPGDSKQMTDVLGILEQADAGSFAVRTRDGNLVVIPRRACPGRESGATTARPPAPGRPQASLTGDPGRARPGHRPAAPRCLLTSHVPRPSARHLTRAEPADRAPTGEQPSPGRRARWPHREYLHLQAGVAGRGWPTSVREDYVR
jgi:hypothetical protein